MLKNIRLTLILGLLLGSYSYAQVIPGGGPTSSGPSSSIIGNLQTATGGNVSDGTLSFTLSQPAVVSGTASVAASTESCYTATDGHIVGVPDPLVAPVLSVNPSTLAGTLPAGTYYVQFTYVNASGESNRSPEATIILPAQGAVIMNAPAIQPAAATGFYNVYMSTTSGSETLMGQATGWTAFAQNVPIVPGNSPPTNNTSSCNIYFSDQLVPTGTSYSVSLFNKNGSKIAGFPQTWCTYGGAGSTINVSSGAPTGNCGTNGVYYPSPLFANSQNNSQQSIGGPVFFLGNNHFSGANIFSGANTHAGLETFNGNSIFNGEFTFCQPNNVLHVGAGIACWSGSDIGAQINSAYAACPANGCTIIIDGKADNSNYDFSTPIVLNTSGKPVTLEGSSSCSATSASSTGNALNYTPVSAAAAITLDYMTRAQSSFGAAHGVANICLINNGFMTSGGQGSAATGISVPNTNGGIQGGRLDNVAIAGFGTALSFLNDVGGNVVIENPQFFANTTAVTVHATTGLFVHGGTIAGNVTGFNCSNSTCSAELTVTDTQMYGNQNHFDFTAASGSPVLLECIACHFENQPSSTTAHFIQGDVIFHIVGGDAIDDGTVGTADWFFSTGSNNFHIEGMGFTSARTVTEIVLANSPVRGYISGYDLTGGGHFTNIVGGANALFVSQCVQAGASTSAAKPCSIEKLQVNAGVSADGAGLKHKRQAGCTTGSTAGNTCTNTVTWTTTFADANYTPVCTLLGTATLGHLGAISTDVIAAASVKVETVTDTNAAITGTVNCIAVHD